MRTLEDLKPWSGNSLGRYHIDFFGVKTDPGFWAGTQPTRPGPVRVSAPNISGVYFEYAACVMAASTAGRPFRVVELGAGWGQWCVRAAVVAYKLGVPVRTIAIEPLPANCERIRRHYLINGLDPLCHEIAQVAIDAAPGTELLRVPADSDYSGRLITREWAARHATMAPDSVPLGVAVRCRDGSTVTRVPVQTLSQTLGVDQPISMIHIRTGAAPHEYFSDPVLAAKNVGVVVVPTVPPAQAAQLDKRMKELGYDCLLSLEKGAQLRNNGISFTFSAAFRVYAGALLRAPAKQAMRNWYANTLERILVAD